MLRIIRHGQRWITGFFIIAVGGGMVFYLGVGGGSGQRAPGSVVVVGDESFGLREFGRARAERESIVQQEIGSEFDARAMSDTLDQLAVKFLIERAILSREASALGIVVSTSEIERLIRSIPDPDFAGEDGQFDPARYKSKVEYDFGNERSFIRAQRSLMLGNKFMRTVIQLARVSEGEARQAAIRRLERVQIAFVTLGAQAPAADFKPDPVALQAFATSRELDLRGLYEQRSSLYDMPEQVHASHILLSIPAGASAEEDEAIRLRAEGILEQLRESADFAALATELSEDPGSGANGGDLGFLTRDQMAKELEDAAFSLEPGTVSELVKSRSGYHIIRVEEHRDAHQRSFEEVREELATELMSLEVARTESRKIADRIAEAIRNGSSLEDAARAENLSLQRSDRLQRRADGYIPNLGASVPVMAAAFNMEPGQSSDRVFDVGGSMALIQVMERFPPDEDAVEAAVDQERSVLVSQKQQAYLSTWINQVRAKLAQDGDLIINLAVLQGGR